MFGLLLLSQLFQEAPTILDEKMNHAKYVAACATTLWLERLRNPNQRFVERARLKRAPQVVQSWNRNLTVTELGQTFAAQDKTERLIEHRFHLILLSEFQGIVFLERNGGHHTHQLGIAVARHQQFAMFVGTLVYGHAKNNGGSGGRDFEGFFANKEVLPFALADIVDVHDQLTFDTFSEVRQSGVVEKLNFPISHAHRDARLFRKAFGFHYLFSLQKGKSRRFVGFDGDFDRALGAFEQRLGAPPRQMRGFDAIHDFAFDVGRDKRHEELPNVGHKVKLGIYTQN